MSATFTSTTALTRQPMSYIAPRVCGVIDECRWSITGDAAEIVQFAVPIWTPLTAVTSSTSARALWQNSLKGEFAGESAATKVGVASSIYAA